MTSSSRTASRTSRCVAASPRPPAASAACGTPARAAAPGPPSRSPGSASPACAARPAPRAGPGPSPTQTCGPRANASCERAFAAVRVEHVGVGEDRGVAVGAGQRDPDQVAARDLGARRARRRGWRSGRRPPPRAPSAATPRRAPRTQPGRPRRPRRLARVRSSTCADRVEDHALGGLDAAEHQHRGVGDHLLLVERRRPRRRAASRPVGREPAWTCPARAAIARRAPSGGTGRSAREEVTAATIAAYQPEHGVRVGRRQAEHVRDHGHRQRPGERAPQLRASRRRRTAPPGHGRASSTSAAEPVLHPGRPERRDERRPVTGVLRAVEREHARAHHPGGREPRVVDGEGRRCRASPRPRRRGRSPASRPRRAPTRPARSPAAGPAPGGRRRRARRASRPRRAGSGRLATSRSVDADAVVVAPGDLAPCGEQVEVRQRLHRREHRVERVEVGEALLAAGPGQLAARRRTPSAGPPATRRQAELAAARRGGRPARRRGRAWTRSPAPWAGSSRRSGSARTLASEPRKSPSGCSAYAGSNPIDGVMVGSTWSPANSSPAAAVGEDEVALRCGPGSATASRVRLADVERVVAARASCPGIPQSRGPAARRRQRSPASSPASSLGAGARRSGHRRVRVEAARCGSGRASASRRGRGRRATPTSRRTVDGLRVVVAVHVRDQEAADVGEPRGRARPATARTASRDSGIAQPPSTRTRPSSVSIDVDVDRAQPVHRQRQRDPVHAVGDLVGAGLGPVRCVGHRRSLSLGVSRLRGWLSHRCRPPAQAPRTQVRVDAHLGWRRFGSALHLSRLRAGRSAPALGCRCVTSGGTGTTPESTAGQTRGGGIASTAPRRSVACWGLGRTGSLRVRGRSRGLGSASFLSDGTPSEAWARGEPKGRPHRQRHSSGGGQAVSASASNHGLPAEQGGDVGAMGAVRQRPRRACGARPRRSGVGASAVSASASRLRDRVARRAPARPPLGRGLQGLRRTGSSGVGGPVSGPGRASFLSDGHARSRGSRVGGRGMAAFSVRGRG